jgi:hypothetical protein
MLRSTSGRLLLIVVGAAVLIGMTVGVSPPRNSPYAPALSEFSLGAAGAYASQCPDEMCYQLGGERQCAAVVGSFCVQAPEPCNVFRDCPP